MIPTKTARSNWRLLPLHRDTAFCERDKHMLETMAEKVSMILILTREGDEHAHFVIECLKQKNARFVRFETARFPETIWETLTFNGTSRVERIKLLEHMGQSKLAPCTFQEYVDKKIELRVTVFDRKGYAAEIDSQSQEFSKIDCRKTPSDPNEQNCYSVPQRRYSLAPETEEKILRFVEHLGLVFGCLDFIITPQGQLVFLEINPDGQWYWIEEVTGMPMLDSFTEMLIQGRPDFVENTGGRRRPMFAPR
ncbi:MAG: hypothetical protein WA672_06860 [Candidatus Angelobacter sp.]